MTTEEAVDDFLQHHGVVGMKKGFPKTNLDRISRMARGTAKLKSTLEKAQAKELKKVESDAKKVQAHEKAMLVVDAGPTKILPKVKTTSTDEGDVGESFAKSLLKKCGKTRVVDLGK